MDKEGKGKKERSQSERGARKPKEKKVVETQTKHVRKCIDESKSLILALSEHCWWV